MAFLGKLRASSHYNNGSLILSRLDPSSSTPNEYIRAINHLTKATELDQTSAYAFHNLAHAWYRRAECLFRIHLSQRQFKDEDEYATYASEHINDPELESVRQRFIKDQANGGLIDTYFISALASVDRALEIQSHFPQAHNTRAMILAKLGRIDEAIEATGVALSQMPSYQKAADNLAKMLTMRQQAADTLDKQL